MYLLLTCANVLPDLVVNAAGVLVLYLFLGGAVLGYTRRETGLSPTQALAYRDYMWLMDQSMGLAPSGLRAALFWPGKLVVDEQIADLARSLLAMTREFDPTIAPPTPGRPACTMLAWVFLGSNALRGRGADLRAALVVLSSYVRDTACVLTLGCELQPEAGPDVPLFVLVVDEREVSQNLVDAINRALAAHPRNGEILPGRRLIGVRLGLRLRQPEAEAEAGAGGES